MLSIKKCLTDVVNFIAGVKDYVVEEGTSGTWYYIKYKSGKCIIWGQGTVNTGKYIQTWNGCSEVGFSVIMPFDIHDIVVSGTSRSGSGFGWLTASTDYNASTKALSLYTLGSQQTSTVYYYLQITGLYK